MFKKLFCLSIMLMPIASLAADQVLVLSGGDNPGINNYSQYLQTKTIYTYLTQKYGTNNVAIFFGMGNNQATVNPFPDVHQIKTINKVATDYMIPGIIDNNIAATKNNVYQFFFQPNIYGIKPSDNLRIFVSDHGLPDLFMENKSNGEFSDNCIDLWNFNHTLVNNFSNKMDFSKVCLSKNALSGLLSVVPAKHIIFEMSQCYSGGFHQLSVTNRDGYPVANTKICGFTASTPDHYASGCTADANGPAYQGYERSFTEWYTGVNIPDGKQIRKPATDTFSAHQNAILEDKTVDTPISTSTYYLLQWALLFESATFKSRVSGYSDARITNIFNHYLQYLPHKNAELNQFKQLIEQDQKLIMAKYPQDRAFFNLNLAEQKEYINNLEKHITTKGNELEQQNFLFFNVLLVNTIYPIWRANVTSHSVPNLSDKEYLMEKELYFLIVDKKIILEPYQSKMLYLQYLAIHNNDPELVKYNTKRLNFIENFALKQKLSSLANATRSAITLDSTITKGYDQLGEMEKEKQLLKRTYLYRSALAAWVTLIQINDKSALKDLQGLIICEHS